MGRQIVLLRGINLGSRNRVAMPALRELLGAAGFGEIRTYLQSGNVVLDADRDPDTVAMECERQIAGSLGLDVAVVVRTRDELADVVARNPLGDIVTDPKRYQVSFLTAELAPDALRRLESVRAEPERLVAHGREVYAWHPDGVGRSKLWAQLASRGLGVTATARNWSTVTSLLELADRPGGEG